MNLQLPGDIDSYVKSLVLEGRFDTEEAVIVEGMRLLMSQEKLRSEIQKGIEQLDRGEGINEQSVFDEVNAEIDRIESSQQGS